MAEKDTDTGVFDPTDHNADEVKDYLDDATEQEKGRVGAAEAAPDGKRRKTVLEAAGVDEGVRMDASGRRLNGWEVEPTPSEELEN